MLAAADEDSDTAERRRYLEGIPCGGNKAVIAVTKKSLQWLLIVTLTTHRIYLA